MKDLRDIRSVQDVPELREGAEEMAQFIFSTSQDNLIRPMPWGDEDQKSMRNPTMISDQSGILLSGVPPHWVNKDTIEFGYNAPHSEHVEYGTRPHPIAAEHLVAWVNRKLGKTGNEGLRAAYAIATKIKREGIPPHPFVRPALHAGKERYGLEIRADLS